MNEKMKYPYTMFLKSSRRVVYYLTIDLTVLNIISELKEYSNRFVNDENCQLLFSTELERDRAEVKIREYIESIICFDHKNDTVCFKCYCNDLFGFEQSDCKPIFKKEVKNKRIVCQFCWEVLQTTIGD